MCKNEMQCDLDGVYCELHGWVYHKDCNSECSDYESDYELDEA